MAHPRADQVHDGESVNEMDTHTHKKETSFKGQSKHRLSKRSLDNLWSKL